MATTETKPERQVREEQEEHEREQAHDPEPVIKEAAAGQDGEAELFDRSQYDKPGLQLPKVDGEPTDKIAIAFSGTVLLDRSDPADVALMKRMKLGGDVTLMVEAKCSGKGHRFTTDREGELDAVVLEHKAKVHTVYTPVDEPEAA